MADTGIGIVYSLYPFKHCPLTEHYDEGTAGWFTTPGKEQEEEVDKALWELIKEHDLERTIRQQFKLTRPIWYGFWIDSPLTRERTSVLYELFSALAVRFGYTGKEMTQFLHVLQMSADDDCPLYVKATPPGHTDFGIVTTYVHCPCCKAEGPLGCWPGDYTKTLVECAVCGQEYSPADTYDSCRDYFDYETHCASCRRKIHLSDLRELYSDVDMEMLEEHLEYERVSSECRGMQIRLQLRNSLSDKYPRLKIIFASKSGHWWREVRLLCFKAYQRRKSNWSQDDEETLSRVSGARRDLEERIKSHSQRAEELQTALESRRLHCPYCEAGSLEIIRRFGE